MALAITLLKIATAPIGISYTSAAITTTGGTGSVTFAVTTGALPGWASMNTSTGVITGTPTLAGVYNFTVTATDSSATPLTAIMSYMLVVGSTKISDIASWVYSDYLNRADITAICRTAAIKVYRTICAKIPFEELYTVTPEMALTSGQSSFDLSQLVPPLLGIVDVRMTFSSTSRRRLRRSAARLYDSLGIVNNGKPATYSRAVAKAIDFEKPVDSSSYTLRVRYWSRPVEDANTYDTVLATPLEWNTLFEWETAWQVLNMIGQEERAMLLITPSMMPRQSTPKKVVMHEVGIIPRLYNELLTTISQKENVDENFGINPVMRNYSVRGR